MADVRAAEVVDEASWEDLSDALLLADVGVITAGELVAEVRLRVGRDGLPGGVGAGVGVLEVLKEVLVERLGGVDRSLALGGSP